MTLRGSLQIDAPAVFYRRGISFDEAIRDAKKAVTMLKKAMPMITNRENMQGLENPERSPCHPERSRGISPLTAFGRDDKRTHS